MKEFLCHLKPILIQTERFLKNKREELIYEQSKLEIAQIPPVIEFAKECTKELKEAQSKLSKIDSTSTEKFNKEFKDFKEQENKKLQDRIKEVKSKCKEGLISGQAKDNTIKIPSTGWFASDVIGIDKGISALMIENYLSEMIWKIYMDIDYVQNGLNNLGFHNI